MLKTNTKPRAYLTWYSSMGALRCQDGGASISSMLVRLGDCLLRTFHSAEGTEEVLPSVRLEVLEANWVAVKILFRPV